MHYCFASLQTTLTIPISSFCVQITVNKMYKLGTVQSCKFCSEGTLLYLLA